MNYSTQFPSVIVSFQFKLINVLYPFLIFTLYTSELVILNKDSISLHVSLLIRFFFSTTRISVFLSVISNRMKDIIVVNTRETVETNNKYEEKRVLF